MSCYQVSDLHINVLVSWAADICGSNMVSYYWKQRGRREKIRGDEKRIASVLFAENVRSVNARYQGIDKAHGFKFKRVSFGYSPISAVEIIKACHGYAYQACEADGWEQSEAFAILDGIQDAAMRALPGYDEAAWEIRDLKKVSP